ncbi:helix-turn-helix domain-containing protein [Phyllobacterium sp. NPDC097923]|uniref:helix-turn-helix domain-containing protein n=1 Tax=Phyllobacterium sp. NPDC097923 TaxID=3364404 RepID=UPI00383B7B9C
MAIRIPQKQRSRNCDPRNSDFNEKKPRREGQEVFFTVQELALRWQLTPRHIRRLIAGKSLAVLHIGRAVRIRESAVVDFENKCPS